MMPGFAKAYLLVESISMLVVGLLAVVTFLTQSLLVAIVTTVVGLVMVFGSLRYHHAALEQLH